MRTAAEIAIGAIYAIGVGFHLLYTVRHSHEFYGDFADRAWFPPARSFTNTLIVPHGVVFTVCLIGFQASIAVAILSRGDAVVPALAIGGAFALIVALFSSPGGTAGNLVLAIVQFVLAGTH